MVIIGIACSMLLGPDERLQDCECPVAVWSVISEVHLSSQHQDGYVGQVGKETKDTFAFCAAGNTGWKGTSDLVLSLKYFIHAAKYRWPARNLLWPLIIFGPLEIWCGPWKPIWPTIRPTAVRYLIQLSVFVYCLTD
jgi:hypothetical protein